MGNISFTVRLMMSFAGNAIQEMKALIGELNTSLDSCVQLRLEMALAALASENLVNFDALVWLPPFVSFWVEGNSPLLKYNARTNKYEKFGSHL